MRTIHLSGLPCGISPVWRRTATAGPRWRWGRCGICANGQVDVGSAVLDENDENQLSFNPDTSVFATVLSPQVLFNFAVWTTEPGIDANDGPLPAGAPITPEVTQLWFWDGKSPVQFVAAPHASAGFAPDPFSAGPLGGFHYHPLFGIRDLTADGNPLPDGVYLAQCRLRIAGLADSAPYYFVALVDAAIHGSPDPDGAVDELRELVFAYIAEPQTAPRPSLAGKDFTYFADAFKYVEIQVVPEPANSLLVLACIAAALRRRRVSDAHTTRSNTL